MTQKMRVQEIWKARKRIAPLVKKTPLIQSPLLSEKMNRPVFLKLETVHDIGAFKVRGAANKILALSEEQKSRGVTTYSTGNHGMAVAFIAKKLGIRATVCISSHVPEAKVALLETLGADVEITGESQDAAGSRCFELQDRQGLTVIEPFDDRDIIAGQGTIGLELLEDLPEMTDVIIPLSGGGLLSGIGLAVKTNNPAIRITGVSMEQSAVMYESLKAGRPVEMEESPTLADSLLGGIGLNNKFTFRMVQEYMDDVLLIPESRIAYSMAYMMDKHRLIVEGAAATGVAAVLGDGVPFREGPAVVIISGQNAGMASMIELMERYIAEDKK